MDRPPVHELSAVNGHSLRFKYRATAVSSLCANALDWDRLTTARRPLFRQLEFLGMFDIPVMGRIQVYHERAALAQIPVASSVDVTDVAWNRRKSSPPITSVTPPPVQEPHDPG